MMVSRHLEMRKVASGLWRSLVGANRWRLPLVGFVVAVVLYGWRCRGWPALPSLSALKELAMLVGVALFFLLMLREWWDLGMAFVGEDFWQLNRREQVRRLRYAAAPIACVVGTLLVVIVREGYFGD